MRRDLEVSTLRKPAEEGSGGSSGSVEVSYGGGESYRVAMRHHEVLVDHPEDAGGEDLAPTPVELFVASLASCVGFYAGRYLARHSMPLDGLRVYAEFDMAQDRPTRVAEVRLRLSVPAELSETRKKGLRAVARHCTVHNSVSRPPEVVVELV